MLRMLEVTGERLLPEQQRGELVHAEHFARYRFAAKLVSGKRVLDAASGEGYGTAMLAAAGAAGATGVELDGAAVSHAAEKYGLEYVKGDVCSLPFGDASFDVVASFETIEHVADPAQAIAEFKRVLGPGGLLVISTPNKREFLVGNEFHTREFDPAEFSTLLGEHFSDVRFAYQQNWLLSAILGKEQFALEDEQRPLDLEVTKTTGYEPGRELFTIAVCGDSQVEPRDIAVATGIFEAHKLLEWVERAGEAERQLTAWTERAEEAERLVEAWNERATEAERQLQQARNKLEAVEGSLSWRLTRPLRAAKGIAGRTDR
jgi:SAM-dependent methyltransferase